MRSRRKRSWFASAAVASVVLGVLTGADGARTLPARQAPPGVTAPAVERRVPPSVAPEPEPRGVIEQPREAGSRPVRPVVSSDTVVVFGPRVYGFTAGQGRYTAHVDSFGAGPPGAGRRYVLRVVNGNATGSSRASALIASVNATHVIGPSDLDRTVAALARDVSLAASNTLRLWVAGNSGDYVTVSVLRVPDSSFTAFGPTSFTRAAGAPPVEVRTFGLPFGAAAPYQVVVTNGLPDGRQRVTEALVRLNGEDLLAPGELDRGVARLVRPVALGTRNRLEVRITGEAGSSLTVAFTASDLLPPVIAVTSPAESAVVASSSITVNGTVTDATPVTLTLNGTPVTLGSGGSFSAGAGLVLGPNSLTLLATDAVGRTSTVIRTVVREVGPPPDPALVAPPLDPTGVTPFVGMTSFLYTGSDPIQTGVAPGTIEAKRAAVIRGRVLTLAGDPLPLVRVAVLKHPEFGQTLSREDGTFDLAVNGGGPQVVTFSKSGFLSAQRLVRVPWRDFVALEDVALVQPDSAVTPIDFSAPVQIARGSPVADSSGPRRATMLFDQGTTATMVFPDQSTQPLASLHVRATEYTVGSNGPLAMPVALPPASAYTYCVDLTADEALAAGAQSVTFSRPVSFYVENFIGLPVGRGVPLGTYDPAAGEWRAERDGLVIAVLDTAGGVAGVDATGDSLPESAASLDSLGITAGDRQRLASLYSPGQTLWHAELSHFSPEDFNVGFFLPDDRLPTPPDVVDPPDDEKVDEPEHQCGSIIECENQVLGERIPIVGTPFSLNYRSNRAPGNRSARKIEIPLTGTTVPSSMTRVRLEVHTAGTVFKRNFDPDPNLRWTYEWSGHDAYGRLVLGRQRALVRIGYEYLRVAAAGAGGGGGGGARSSFGRSLPGLALTTRTRTSGIEWFEQTALVGTLDMGAAGLGGWTLDPHHAFDPQDAGTLYLGDGGAFDGQLKHPIIKYIGGGSYSFALTPDGGRYEIQCCNQSNGGKVFRVTPDGTSTLFAGTGGFGLGGDGGPALQATFNEPGDLAVGPDGSVYVADTDNCRVRKIDPAGIINTVAGSTPCGCAGTDGQPGTQWSFNGVYRIAVAVDGVVYFTSNCGIYRLHTDGIVERVPGIPTGGGYLDVATGIDGSLYAAYNTGFFNKVFRVAPDGKVTEPVRTDGTILSIAIAPDGTIYYGLRSVDGRPWVNGISPNGTYIHVASNGIPGSAQLELPATQTPVSAGPMQVDLEGRLDLLETGRLTQIRPAAPGFSITEVLRASQDGSEMFVFDVMGRHQRTLNALTGANLFVFGYDGGHRLVTVRDGDGNVTTIERDGLGRPAAIVGPYAHRTELGVDASGYLASIRDPAGNRILLSADGSGLLRQLTDPRQNVHTFDYDPYGLLASDQDPAGGSQTLARTDSTHAFRVARTTGENRTTTYRSREFVSGDHQRVVTEPSGLSTVTYHGTNEVTTTSSPNGMTSTATEGPDPRYGMQAPVMTSRTLRTPAGLTLDVSARRVHLQGSGGVGDNSIRDEVTINGRRFESTYDAALRKLTEVTPLNRQIMTTVDSAGRPLTVSVPGLAPIQSQYDGRGRLMRSQQGGRVWQYAYDDSGRVSRITDPVLRATDYFYDASDRLIRLVLPGPRTVGFDYDSSGNVKHLVPPESPPHGFGYTPVDLMGEYAPPDLGAGERTTRFSYERDRDLAAILRPDSQLVDIDHDAAGRRERVTIARGAVPFTYSPTTGNLSSIGSPDGVVLGYAYDGILLTQESWSGAVNGAVSLTYGNDFRPTTQSVNGGQTVAFGYDNDGLLTSAGALTITRDPNHGLIRGTTLAGMTTSHGYSHVGEPASLVARFGGTTLLQTGYERDSLGRIVRLTETVQGVSQVFDYGYDLSGRLADVHTNGVLTHHFGYDANGNRRVFAGTTPVDSATGSYDAQDRLLRYGSSQYDYTKNGELRTKIDSTDTTRYAYDELGNLITVRLPNGDRIDYLMDGQSRRVAKKVNGVLRRAWLYQNGLNPVAELDSLGNVVARFVYGTKRHVPDYMVRGGNTYRIVTDHVGSVRLVVEAATGALAQRMDYDAYGRLLQDTNPGFQPFGFAGGLFESTTGLVRFGMRDYDAKTGRWTAKDPSLFLSGSMNVYQYVDGDPVNFVDPLGLAVVCLYSQHTGQLVCFDLNGGPPISETGYAGHGPGKNNPDMQCVPNVGPLPQGRYDVGRMRDTSKLKDALPLSPEAGPDACPTTNRFGFFIHGDSSKRPGEASEGCIVVSHGTRSGINNRGGGILNVLP